MVNINAVIVWRYSPVLIMVIFIGEVLLMVSEESIELDALFEVFNCFETSDMLQKFKVTIHIDTCTDQTVPMHTL